MTLLEQSLRRWRVRRAMPHIPAGSRVLDIGCADGLLFEMQGSRIAGGLGIDPELPAPIERSGYRLVPGRVPDGLPSMEPVDVIAMLAVVEHFRAEELPAILSCCAGLLKPGGVIVVTVPAPAVDQILHVLQWLRLVDGMCVHQHHGFDPRGAPALFAAQGLRLTRHTRFQLGLNHLFVFRKPAVASPTAISSGLAGSREAIVAPAWPSQPLSA